MSERVEREFNEWKKRYDIPFEDEFMLKTVLELQEQFDNEDKKNVRTKRELLDMIIRTQSYMKLKPKQNKFWANQSIFVLVENETCMRSLFALLRFIINNDSISEIKDYKEYKNICLNNGVKLIIEYKPTNAKEFNRLKDSNQFKSTYDRWRNYKIDSYVNLTDDIIFEREVLEPMLNK